MKNIILFTIVWLTALSSSAQCSADFTWLVSGNTVQLTNTSAGTNFNSWSFGDGGSSMATNPNYTYSTPGSYDICLYSYYADSMGNFCDDSVCYQVVIIDTMGTGCAIGASIYGSGTQIIGTNTSAGASSYEWTVFDYNTGATLNNSFTTNLSYSPGYFGDFWVCLNALDSAGFICDSLCNIITLVDTMSNPCNATTDFTWSTAGNTVQFTNTSTGTNNNDWSFGDGGNSIATNPTHTYAAAGTYTVCLHSYYTDSIGTPYCGDTTCYSITVIDTMQTNCMTNATIYSSGSQIIGTNTSTGASFYNWTVSDYSTGAYITTATTTNLNYSPGYNGNFLVCLTSYQANGLVCDTLCNVVTVIDTMSNPCNATAGFTWSISGNTVQFANTSTGTNNNDWSFGDGGYSYATNPTHTYTNPGTYTACLYSYYTDSMGVYCDDSVCYSITVIDTMQTNCMTNATIYSSGSQIIGTNTSTGASFYNWTVSDYSTGAYVTTATTTNLNYFPGYNGNFLVCLTSYQANGLVCDTVCNVVTVIDTMSNPCNATAGFTWSISGNTVQFANTSTGTNNNEWSFGDSGYSFATNPNHTYTNPGTYTVCLYSYYTDSMGVYCGDSVCYPVTIIDTMGTGCAISASIYGLNGEIIGTNASTGASSYEWTVFDYNTGATLNNSFATNLNYSPGYFGDFWVCLNALDSSGYICDSLCQIVTLYDSTGTGCSVSASIYSNVNEIVGTNTSTGASFFSWTITDYGTGAFVGSATTTDLSYYPNYTGNFWVCLTAYDSSGYVCDTLCDVVTAVYDSLDSTANVPIVTFNEFKLYPNPTNAILNLKFDHLPSNAHARIVDLLGREMIEVDVTSEVTEIQVADFPSGIYIVQLIDANNQVMGMHKFVRE